MTETDKRKIRCLARFVKEKIFKYTFIIVWIYMKMSSNKSKYINKKLMTLQLRVCLFIYLLFNKKSNRKLLVHLLSQVKSSALGGFWVKGRTHE